MYISPFLLFSGIWGIVILSFFFYGSSVVDSISIETFILVSSLIFLGGISSLIFRLAMPRYVNSITDVIKEKIDFKKLHYLNLNFFYIWLFLYFLIILYLGGFPLYWVISGDERTYVDFSIPTLSGLLNLLRAFMCVNVFIIFLLGDGKYKRIQILIFFILISSAWIIETGRGNGIVLLLHPIAFYLLITKFNLKKVIYGTGITLIILLLSGFIQVIRYGEDLEYLAMYIEGQGITVFDNPFILLLTPAYMYIIFPIINLDLNIANASLLQFTPYQSVQGLFPSIIRENIFIETQNYGVLINEANNTTSMLTPLVRDFGIIGALITSLLFLSISFYTYRKAISGNIFYIFCYPPLFMSVCLSFFSLYFTSLVVLLYPILVMISLPFFKKN